MWSLRVNPSSGNLHPTEAYVISPVLHDSTNAPSLFHYQAKDHSLERRANYVPGSFDSLVSSLGHNQFVLVGLSSIVWREAWKYGERAFRYCQHDIGHALAALSVSASSLGWDVSLVDTLSTEKLDSILCLNRREEFPPGQYEESEVMVLLSPNIPLDFSGGAATFSSLNPVSRYGVPNLLSKHIKDWPVIQAVSHDTVKQTSDGAMEPSIKTSGMHSDEKGASNSSITNTQQHFAHPDLLDVIRRRRSALAFDPAKSEMPLDVFMSILIDGCVASRTPGLYNFWKYQKDGPFVHLLVFVHRVKDLEPGLYMLVRGTRGKEKELEEATASLKQAMPKLLWSPVEEELTGEQTDFGLYQLMEHNVQEAASIVSCLQDIAGDGSFSVGMLSNLPQSLKQHGAWFYRRLFWEAGIIGQSLYLHAEAHGFRGTGIGCYHDDDVHEAVCSMTGSDFQSLYHFTVGTAITDPRIQTIEPYPQHSAEQPNKPPQNDDADE